MPARGGVVSPVTEWSTFRPDVEGLRAIAVLLVVAFHYGVTALPGGFIGVDVFFVISGFVITRMLRTELANRGSIDLVRFYGRRARRLLPASLTMIVATLVASTVLLSPFEIKDLSKAAAASSLYFSNFWFMSRASDYFAPESGTNPFLHTWTLAVEEQFYLVWPALLLFSSKLSRRGQFASIAILLASSFVISVWLVEINQPVAFYASPFRAWEFALGALVTFIPGTRYPTTTATVGILGIAFSAITLTENSAFPGVNALPSTIGTAALLVAGQQRNWTTAGLGTPALQWLGKLSYSIYLWHWPVIVLARAAFPELRVAGLATCALIALLLAWLSFTCLEHPVRINPWLASRRRRSIALGAGLTAVGAVASACSWMIGVAEAKKPEQIAIQAAATTSSALPSKCISGFTDVRPAECKFYRGQQRIVLLGDSHAAQLFSPISSIARADRMQLVTYVKSSCPVSDVPVFNNRLHRLNPECTEWRRSVVKRLSQFPPTIIVISQSSMGYVTGPGRSGGTITIEPEMWLAGMARTLRALVASGARVFVIQDSPRMAINVPTCVARAVRRGEPEQSCGRPRNLAVDDRLASLEKRVSVAAGAQYIPTTDFFCSSTECPAIRVGIVMYRDGNHISEPFARTLARPLSQRIGELEVRP